MLKSVVVGGSSEQLSGMNLDYFFDVWLYQPEKLVSW